MVYPDIKVIKFIESLNGSQLTSIPDMAKNSTVAKEATVSAGFLAGAKDATVAKEATVSAGFTAGAKDATVAKEATVNAGFLAGAKEVTLSTIITMLNGIITDFSFMTDIEAGDWYLIEPNTLIYYKADHTTIIAQFSCYDIDGNPTIENIASVRREV